MKILFLPNSFPGPFRYTATHFATDKKNKVLFVTGRSRRDAKIQGVGRILLNPVQAPNLEDKAENEAIFTLRHSTQLAIALSDLKNNGFIPDITIAHAGHGYTLYLKDIFPNTFHVAYADGFHNQTNSSSSENSQAFPSTLGKVRNFFQWDSLRNCQLAYTSTHWQKSLYPEELKSKIQVFHEGIDTNFFSYTKKQDFSIIGLDGIDNELDCPKELITFSGRSAGFNSSFPIFFHCLPRILKERPKCHVLIITQGSNKALQKEWHKTLSTKYNVDTNRVHYINFLPYNDYLKILHASNVHIFLSASLALSSGLFEAMSCGCLVLGPDTAPVREVIKHGINGFLYDLNDINTMSETIITLLERNESMENIRLSARKSMLDSYSIQNQTPKLIDFILKNYQN